MAAPAVRYRAAGRESDAVRLCSEATAVGEGGVAETVAVAAVLLGLAVAVGEIAG
jgi:hypothetical protein